MLQYAIKLKRITMTKTNRIIFKIASIISSISSTLTLLIALALLFNVKFVCDIYYDLYISSIESLEININFYKFISIINLTFSSFLNHYCSKVYSSISRMSNNVKFGNLNSLYGLAIFQLILGSTYVPAILCVIGVIMYNINIKKHPAGQSNELKKRPVITKAILKDMSTDSTALKSATIINIPQEILTSMAQDINKIKLDLSKGLITEEEYMKLLNTILEGKKLSN